MSKERGKKSRNPFGGLRDVTSQRTSALEAILLRNRIWLCQLSFFFWNSWGADRESTSLESYWKCRCDLITNRTTKRSWARSKMSVCSRLYWNFFFGWGRKPKHPEKNPLSRQQTQSTFTTRNSLQSRNNLLTKYLFRPTSGRNRTKCVGAQYSHHCAIPAPHKR